MELAEIGRCPRCKGSLHSRRLDELTVSDCSDCAGLWVTSGALEALCRRAQMPDSFAASSLDEHGRFEPDTRVVYLPCPDCKSLMMRRTIASGAGVIVDVCQQHGLWLDHGELEKILAFVRARGIDELAVLRPPKPTIAERADLEQARRRLLLAERRNSTSEILFDILVQLAEMLMMRR